MVSKPGEKLKLTWPIYGYLLLSKKDHKSLQNIFECIFTSIYDVINAAY